MYKFLVMWLKLNGGTANVSLNGGACAQLT
jgi:hypothetical protein